MPRPGLRTGRFRRIVRKIPGGALVIHYKKKRPGRARCAVCGKPLHGARPSRPYGNMCSACSREKIKNKALKGEKQ